MDKAQQKLAEKEERERLMKQTEEPVKAIPIDVKPWTYDEKVAHIKGGKCKLQQKAPKLRCPFDCQILAATE